MMEIPNHSMHIKKNRLTAFIWAVSCQTIVTAEACSLRVVGADAHARDGLAGHVVDAADGVGELLVLDGERRRALECAVHARDYLAPRDDGVGGDGAAGRRVGGALAVGGGGRAHRAGDASEGDVQLAGHAGAGERIPIVRCGVAGHLREEDHAEDVLQIGHCAR